jgi:tetratricopeptide (TPR) repeat protein
MNLLKLGPALSYLPLGKSLVLGTLAITAATSSVALQQGSAIAQVISSSAVTRDIDRNEIDKSRNVTVKILGATEGSGVLIGHDDETHTVLTAWHVISSNNRNEEITIKTFDNRTHTTNIEESIRIGNLDLAIIRFKSNVQYKAVNYPGKDLTPSDMLYVMGYPNTTGTYKKTVGSLIASADVGIDQGYQLLYTNNTRSGMSGGPIFDSDYNLIGIHGRGEYNNLKNNNSLQKTNINQGIPIFYYGQHKDGRPIKAESKDPMTWSDYMALYNSTEKQTESNYDKNIDYKPTLLRFVEMMIRLKPKQSMNYILRASIMTDNNYNTETPDVKKSLQLISEYQSIQTEIAQLMGMGDKELVLKKLLSLDDYVYGVGSENHLLKSYVYLARNEPNKAVKSAIFALEMELEAYDNGHSVTTKEMPSEVTISSAYTAKGKAYFQMEKFEDAVYAFKNALKWRTRVQLTKVDMNLFPNDGSVFALLGASYFQLLKRNSSEQGKLANAYRLTKDNTEITYSDVCKSWIKAIRNGSKGKLLDGCNTILKFDITDNPVEEKDIKSNFAKVNTVYAEIRKSYNIKTHDETIRNLNKLIDLDPKFALTYYLKGQMFYNLKQYKKCLKEMNKTIKIKPGFHDAYFQRALCKEDLGNTIGALDDYAISQKLKPSLDAQYNVAMLYNRMATEDSDNKFYLKKALLSILKGIEIVEADKLLSNSPSYPGAIGFAGLLYGKIGDMKNACLYLKRAVSLNDQFSIELIGKLKEENVCLQ